MSLVRGDAIAIPLRDESVDLIVTSPPYFALRSYTDGGEHYDGQIGSEPTPQAFLEALWAVTAECRRVLKPSGSMFVNLGDKYAGSGGNNNANLGERATKRGPTSYNKAAAVPAKSLMGLPWRYAIGCIDNLDLILRAEIVWSKPNGLPESVTDRVRRSHEQWFMFTKSPRYFSAVDEIRESRGEVVEPAAKHLPGCPLFGGPSDALRAGAIGGRHEGVPGVELFDLTNQEGADERVEGHHIARAKQEREIRPSASVPPAGGRHADLSTDPVDLVDDGGVPVVDVQSEMGGLGTPMAEGNRPFSVDDSGEPSQVCLCGHTTYHSAGLGKLPGSVWTIASEPLKVPEHVGVDHFAAFPQEWPRRLILGWSPSGICTVCGEGRRPVVEKERVLTGSTPERSHFANEHVGGDRRVADFSHSTATITGYACACPDTTAPTRPAIILDPFGGTGTTAMVARALGRYPVHIDLSADYLRLARWRVYESGHAAKTEARTNRERQGVLL